MAEFPVLPIFTDAYLADTRHLTAAEHGAYLLLLISAWRMTDCSLPDDDQLMSRCAAMDVRTWRQHKSTVMQFWKLGDDQKWRQARLTDERKSAVEQRRKNADAGKSSSLKRKERHSTKAQPNVNVTSTPLNPSLKSSSSEAKASSDSHRSPNELGDAESKKKTKLPKEWRPNAAHRAKCGELGFDADKLVDEPNGFVNYHTARGNKFENWDRAFWTWIGNAEKFSAKSNSRPSVNGKSAYGDSIAGAATAVLDNIRREESLRAEEVH